MNELSRFAFFVEKRQYPYKNRNEKAAKTNDIYTGLVGSNGNRYEIESGKKRITNDLLIATQNE